jgi:peptidoglycan-associated lipoprotein
MNKNFHTTLLLSLLLGSLVLFGAGCSKKTVVPPGIDGETGSTLSGGKDINYPPAQGGEYSEENLPTVGTLDDTEMENTTVGETGPPGEGVPPANQTAEYRQVHGRSSANLLPIYFDFDQAGIKPDMEDILIQNARYIQSIPGTTIIIEGNSDERGTNEYNLALGERRAINTRQFLINLGVDPVRIRTLSFGEEKPLFLEQNEESYRLNRRADFVVK